MCTVHTSARSVMLYTRLKSNCWQTLSNLPSRSSFPTICHRPLARLLLRTRYGSNSSSRDASLNRRCCETANTISNCCSHLAHSIASLNLESSKRSYSEEYLRDFSASCLAAFWNISTTPFFALSSQLWKELLNEGVLHLCSPLVLNNSQIWCN